MAGKPAGTTLHYAAIGTYMDATTVDLTNTVVWSSGDRTVATIGAGGLANALAPGAAVIAATSNGITASAAMRTVTPATLAAIQVTPAVASSAVGVGQQYTAVGLFTDGTAQDISTSVNWTSNDTTKATLDARGRATQDITATVAWTSSDTGKATIDASGLATTVSVGSTTIRATSGSVSNPAALTVTAATLVSIQLSPVASSKAVGLTQQYAAIGNYTDATNQDLSSSVTWVSSDPGTATIGASGLATAVAVGAPTITASMNGVTSNVATLTVTAAALVSIQVTPASTSKARGLTQQYTATGTYTNATTQDITTFVAWLSSDTRRLRSAATASRRPSRRGRLQSRRR